MNQGHDTLYPALRRLLKPLVRLLIQRNLTLPAAVDILKEVYVDVAQEGLTRDLNKATDSHISLITGMHRKDIKKYRTLPQAKLRPATHTTHGGALLATWRGDRKFIDSRGNPLPLPYVNKDDPGFSFTAIAEGISKDIRARALLDEFLRMGLVDFDAKENTVTLKADAFIPETDSDEKLYFLGRNGGDHLEAAVANVLEKKSRFFDRAVYYDGLSPASVEEIRKLASEAAMKTLQDINRKAFELSERDQNDAKARLRFTLGSYFYTDAQDDNE